MEIDQKKGQYHHMICGDRFLNYDESDKLGQEFDACLVQIYYWPKLIELNFCTEYNDCNSDI